MSNLYQLIEQRKRKIIKQAVARLPIRESWAIRMRFWEEGMLIEDIARNLKMSWSDSDQLIKDALAHLKEMVVESIPNLSKKDIALIYKSLDGSSNSPINHTMRSRTVLKALGSTRQVKNQSRTVPVKGNQFHGGAPL